MIEQIFIPNNEWFEPSACLDVFENPSLTRSKTTWVKLRVNASMNNVQNNMGLTELMQMPHRVPRKRAAVVLINLPGSRRREYTKNEKNGSLQSGSNTHHPPLNLQYQTHDIRSTSRSSTILHNPPRSAQSPKRYNCLQIMILGRRQLQCLDCT